MTRSAALDRERFARGGRARAAPRDNGKQLALDGRWTQMRLSRLARRKLLCALALAALVAFVCSQALSYAIIASTPGGASEPPPSPGCVAAYAEPIDVVYTWVNGSEERFLAEMRRQSGAAAARTDAYAPRRFDDKDELKYSLRSLERHMPWARRVYIVTNGQIPSWLDLDHERVTLVTHAEIFERAEDLPTFSSPAIETNLHRIPGLSERFVYFNDDVFLNADVYPEDFYTRNRGYKIYTAWGTDCAHKCDWDMIQNNRCDPPCYNRECAFDGGDCSEHDLNATAPSARPRPVPSIAEYLSLRNETLAISDRIKRYNAEKMRNSKLAKSFRRERENYHLRMMNTLVARLFPSEAEPFAESAPPTDQSKTLEGDEALRKDLYSSSLIYTQKLLGARFGYTRRNVIAHAPIMIDRAIMREVQREYPAEFARTAGSKFRREDNLQVGFVYSYYLALIKERKSLGEIFDEYDTDRSGTWSDREIHTLLTRLYRLPLKMETVLEFQNILNNCTNSLEMATLEEEFRRKAPRYERYVDSALNLVTRRMVVECDTLERVLRDKDNVTLRAKYRHEFVPAAEHVSFNQLHSLASASMEALDGIRRTPKKFVCINDDLDRTNATRGENELSVSLLEDLFMSLFPIKSSFELPAEYRNKFARMEDLRAWQEWRWREPENPWFRTTVFAVFACLLLLCLQLRWARVKMLKLNT